MKTADELIYNKVSKEFEIIDGKLWRINFRGKKNIINNKKNHPSGYCRIQCNGKPSYYHRILFCLHSKKDLPINLHIDHISGDKIDNRIENLRLCTHRKNQQNKNIHRNGKLVGATFEKNREKWLSQIKINGKSIYIGRFDTEKEANKYYTQAAKLQDKFTNNRDFRKLLYNSLRWE
jgi:hypothetical protein